MYDRSIADPEGFWERWRMIFTGLKSGTRYALTIMTAAKAQFQ